MFLHDVVVLFQVHHKLNYFLIFLKILIVNYDENFKNSCSQPSLIPKPP